MSLEIRTQPKNYFFFNLKNQLFESSSQTPLHPEKSNENEMTVYKYFAHVFVLVDVILASLNLEQEFEECCGIHEFFLVPSPNDGNNSAMNSSRIFCSRDRVNRFNKFSTPVQEDLLRKVA